jgi:hypothetical protein
MADAKQKWQDATAQILSALDIIAEYEALQVEIPGSRKPSSKGWVPCRCYGVEDKTPSAAINVVAGPFVGRYKDHRTGETLSLFDFAAKTGKFGGDWKTARKAYAQKAGVVLPDGDDDSQLDKVLVSDLTYGILKGYADGKPGVTVAGIKGVGAKSGIWPKGLSGERTNYAIAIPMYGAGLLDLGPVGLHLVAQNPKNKIRKFQGQGHEDALLKSLTIGEVGLMGLDGLRRLREATVVNIVEGASDILTGQSLIEEARLADPLMTHVVLSAGGCTARPNAEWVKEFANKEVRIWYDVGDKNDEGQNGAKVWVKACLSTAKIVRNILLPQGLEGGKNDLRAWVDGGKKTYADMDEYAKSFAPAAIDDPECGLSPGEALLKNLGLVVIGEHEGTQKVEIYSEQTKKSFTCTDINRVTVPTLVQLLGREAVEKYIHEGAEPPDGKVQLPEVKKAIANAASNKVFYADEKIGAGVWEIEGQIVLVKHRQVGIVQHTKVESSSIPFVRGRFLDIAHGSGDWCDFGGLGRYLVEAQNERWARDVFFESSDLFSKWYWKQNAAPQLVTSLVVASWLQTIWEWRPQVFITGGSDTGKSYLLEEVLTKGIFGQLSLAISKPTEAAIRQHLRHHAKIVMNDEFEKDDHRQKILELFRGSSRGTKVARGTADQRGMSFTVRHIPWFVAIETGLKKQADRNRYIILELQDIPPERRGNVELPPTSRLHDLGQKLLAIGLHYHKRAREIAAVVKGLQIEGVPGRVVESFSVPVGIYAAVFGMTNEQAGEALRGWLASWDFSSQASKDEHDVLDEIFTSEVTYDRGQRSTVSGLLDKISNPRQMGDASDAIDALARVGIRRVNKRFGNQETQHVIFFATDVIRRQLLKNGEYAGHMIDQYLLRLPNAESSRQRLLGSQAVKGVQVPLAVIEKHFCEASDTGEVSGDVDAQEF